MCDQQTNSTNNQIKSACSSELPLVHGCETKQTNAIETLKQFIGKSQLAALMEALEGEEGMHFVKTLGELAHHLDTMPKTYEQEGMGGEAVAHLHYFMGGMDWFITERDMEDEQLQAFGLADLGMGCAELGYISLQEITRNGAELDLHWTPKTLDVIKKTR